MTAKTFGKRAAAAPAPAWREAKAPAPGIVRAPEPPTAPVVPAPAEKVVAVAALVGGEMSVDEELQRWKDERRQTLFARLPWKQFSLIASLSFGIASFVLPDSVNGAVDYLLWGLSLISFAIWISGFFKKKSGQPSPQ